MQTTNMIVAHSGEAQWRIVFSNNTKRAVPEDAKRFRLIVKPWVV